jgi:hypothetical protein
MKLSEYFAEYPGFIRAQTERVRIAIDGMDHAQLNEAPAPGVWSVAQVLQHMTITNRGYLKVIGEAIGHAPEGDAEMAASWLGKLLAKYAGPDKDAPAPKFTIPSSEMIEASIDDQWYSDQEIIAELGERAQGKNTNLVKPRNPYVPIKMLLTDFFNILERHTERHVRQIEERARIVKSRSAGNNVK